MKNIIFDFGQVLVKWDREYMTSRYVPEPYVKEVASIIFDPMRWHAMDKGIITEEDIKTEIAKYKLLPKKIIPSAYKALDNWHNHLQPMEGMWELVGELSKEYNIFLLSNIAISFAENCKCPSLEPLFKHFSGFVFSGPLHIIKPQREIFEHLLNKYDLKAEDCTFVDDNSDNISAAESYGIKSYCFDGNAAALREFLLKK